MLCAEPYIKLRVELYTEPPYVKLCGELLYAEPMYSLPKQ